jgi:hypothetical protein
MLGAYIAISTAAEGIVMDREPLLLDQTRQGFVIYLLDALEPRQEHAGAVATQEGVRIDQGNWFRGLARNDAWYKIGH